MIPDNVEKIIMTKEDYDRNVEQLLVDKCKTEQEIERLNKALLDIKEYIEKSYKEDYGNNENYIPIEHLNLKNCSYERTLVVLDIVNKALGSDKE